MKHFDKRPSEMDSYKQNFQKGPLPFRMSVRKIKWLVVALELRF